jgi:hypothetical protein
MSQFSLAKNIPGFFIDMSMMFRTASEALPFFTTVDNHWSWNFLFTREYSEEEV